MSFLDQFCDDSEGWGPLTKEENDFTLCAQSWIIVFPVCMWAFVVGIFLLIRIDSLKRRTTREQMQKRFSQISSSLATRNKSSNINDLVQNGIFSDIATVEMIVSFCLTLLFSHALIAAAIFDIHDNVRMNWLIFILGCEFISWFVVSYLYYVERKYVLIWGDSCSPSKLVRGFWILQGFIGIKLFESFLLRHFENDRVKVDFDFWFSLALALVMSMLGYRGATMKPQFSSDRVSKPTLEEEASIASWLTFNWLSQMFKTGYKRALELSDLTLLRQIDHAAPLLTAFHQYWYQQLEAAKIIFASNSLTGAQKQPHLEQRLSASYSLTPPNFERLLSPISSAITPEAQKTKKKKKEKSPSIVKAIFYSFGLPFLVAGPLKLVYDITQFAGPVLLSIFLTHAEKFQTSDRAQQRAYILAFLMFATYMVGTFILHQYFHRCFVMGMRIRASLIGACYEKSLKLSLNARKDTTSGQMMTMVTVDVRKVRDVFSYLWVLVSGPFQICIAVYLLYQQISWSVFIGVGTQVFFITPFQAVVGSKTRKLQQQVMKIRDERIKVINEVFGSMKIVKMYAWEMSFGNKIDGIRGRELQVLKKYVYWSIFMTLFWGFAPQLVSLSSFISYTAAGNELTASIAFTSLALFNLLRFPLAVIPMMILSCIEASVALARIRKFLSANELDPYLIEFEALTNANQLLRDEYRNNNDSDNSNSNDENENENKNEDEDETNPAASPMEAQRDIPMTPISGAQQNRFMDPSAINSSDSENNANVMLNRPLIRLENCSFAWDDEGHQIGLSDINCHFPKGSITMIIGETGSGKSALLRAMLGNLHKVFGRVIYSESPRFENEGNASTIAYSSQVAWIQNATVKNNILFGKKLKSTRYNNVVRACALVDDLKILSAGDETEIGEKGINVSGGQKQRISLARAVYSDSDILIADDPLSAVDSHVANHIFKECFLDILKKEGKTIILATHAVSFLRYADNIIVMNEGQIQMQGNLQDLYDAHINLTKFVLKREKSEDNSDDDEKDDIDNMDDTESDVKDDEKSVDESKTGDQSKTIKGKQEKEKEKEKEKNKKKKGELVKDEERGVGQISHEVYFSYLRAAGGVIPACLIIFWMCAYYGANTGGSFWLAIWSDDVSSSAAHSSWYYLEWYSIIQLSSVVGMIFSLLATIYARLSASRVLHKKLLDRLLMAPMQFYDQTPIGRIVNRFSRDIYNIDQAVPTSWQSMLRVLVACFATILGVIVVTPYFMIIIIPLTIFYWFVQKYFIATQRELRRISSLMNSPIYSHFSESIDGTLTIRAFNRINQFSDKNKDLIDADHAAYYPSVAANRWLAIRLEILGNIMIGFAAFSCAFSKPSAGFVGVALSTIMSITQSLNWLIRQKAELEQNVVSVERIEQYNVIKTEAPYVIENSVVPFAQKESWPTNGKIEFKNVFMKYRPELPHVLKGLTFTVNPTQKVGVIGRTGAGKSSLFLTLLRLIEIDNGPRRASLKDLKTDEIAAAIELDNKKGKPSKSKLSKKKSSSMKYGLLNEDEEQSPSPPVNGPEVMGARDDRNDGDNNLNVVINPLAAENDTYEKAISEFGKGHILIDDIDVCELGLQQLRSRISVIPQDPILFTGTVRFNLDPFEQRSDEELFDALKLSHCWKSLKKMAVELEIKKEKDAQLKEKNERKKAAEKAKKKQNRRIFGRKKSKQEGFVLQEDEDEDNDDNDNEAKENDNTLQQSMNGVGSDALMSSLVPATSISKNNKNSEANLSQYINDPKYANLNPLDIEVEENGGNFSVGQRQLLCLARAIVRRSKILLLDEATSAVDPATDQLIQNTIREVFSNNTILTIAHRIDTILDYDKILIMDQGNVLEYDTVDNLLNDKDSKFSEIVQTSFGVNLNEILATKRGGFNKKEEDV